MKALTLVAVYSLLAPIGSLAEVPGIHIQREFDIQLAAAASWNPIAIDWDAGGRMWAAVTSENPLQPPSGRPCDRIVVFNGAATNGSLRSRTFCSGLRAVGGFAFFGDGLIVAEGSRVLLLRDKDGDGVSDRREILPSLRENSRLTGLRWGMDGRVYAVLGGTGIVRFDPRATQPAFEVVSRFQSESASCDFSWDEELFFARAEGPHASHVGMAEKYFSSPGLTNASSHRRIEDHQTVFLTNGKRERFVQVTAGSPFLRVGGAMIYEGGAWPERFHGNYFVCDPALRVIHEDVISRAESAYFEASRRVDEELVVATAPSFHPHALRFGPDGAVYVLSSHSLASPEILHASRTPFRRTASEQPRGGVWRIQHKQARRIPAPDLTAASASDLVHALEHPNGWVRRTALRRIIEVQPVGASVHLEELARSSRFAPARVAALWGLHHLNQLTHAAWTNALQDLHPAVQRNAWLIFAESRPVTPEVEKIFSRQYKDADERVKVAMLMALSKGPLAPATRESVAKLFPDLKDTWARSVVLTIVRNTPVEVMKIAFSSDKSESFRELVVPLVNQLATEPKALSDIRALTLKHAKAEKLTAAVKEALAKVERQ